jgi:transcriptional regulator with XRE-family HTH domain
MYYNYNIIETGKRIKKLREENYITQEQMAERLELSVEHYGRIELGKRGCSLNVLVCIAIEFDVSLDYLIFGKEHCSPAAKRTLGSLIASLQELERTL